MTQSRNAAPTPGLLVVDKPGDWTSHDVVAKVRGLAGTRRVGHAGTLDPLATGVLVLGIGQATKLLTYLVGADKSYDTTIRLGVSTTTDDAAGEEVARTNAAAISASQITAAVAELTGDILQIPSSVSAIKVGGKRAYARVRAGETVTLKPRPVTISKFEVRDVQRQQVDGITVLDIVATIDCSTGTYVRALARDLGDKLGVGGHLTALRRTRVGQFTLADARTLEQLSEQLRVVDIATAARTLFASRQLDADAARALSYGQIIPVSKDDLAEPAGTATAPVAAFAPDGTLVALVVRSDRGDKPVMVVAPADGGIVDRETAK